MYLDHPKITATKSDTEPDRIDRVNRVYGYALAMADQDGNREFIRKLARIHDHKGTLYVVWLTRPTDDEKGYFVSAWQSLIGDESSNVQHELDTLGQ
jgi:hypothetical protein